MSDHMGATGYAPPVACYWREDEDGNWDTDCGETWCLEGGTLAENTVNYCPVCGRPAVEVLYRLLDDEEVME